MGKKIAEVVTACVMIFLLILVVGVIVSAIVPCSYMHGCIISAVGLVIAVCAWFAMFPDLMR